MTEIILKQDTNISRLQLNTSMIWEIKDNRILFYATDYELCRTLNVENPREVFRLFQYLQKPRTIEDVKQYSRLSAVQLRSLVNYMCKKGYFKTEDGNVDSMDLRLSHLLDALPSINRGKVLDEFHQLKIVIIGVGTMGSYATDGLVKLGINELTLIDPDRVEAKNISAQNYTSNDIGSFKVDCLASKYEAEPVDLYKHKIMLNSYKELNEIVDLRKIDYLITSDDDYQLNRDIWSHVFTEFPRIKCVTGGYSLFKSSAFVLSKNNWKKYRTAMDRAQKSLSSAIILSNDGTIFNAMMYGLVIPKLVFDDVTGIEKTTTATFDYLQNNFFLGNMHDFEYYKDFKKNKQKNNVLFTKQVSCTQNWFKRDQVKIGILNDNFDRTQLTTHENLYIGEQTFEGLPNNLKDLRPNRLITFSVKPEVVRSSLMKYIKNHFSNKIFTDSNRVFDNDLILVDPGIYGVRRNYTEWTNDVPLIYINSEGQGTEALEVIHEVFHVIFNHFGNDSYEHESFVLKNTIEFINSYPDLKIGKNLGRQLIKQYKDSYIDFKIVAELEKSIVLGEQNSFLTWFSNAAGNGQEKQLLKLVNQYVEQGHPFFTLRYLLAYEENKKELETLEKWCT